MLFNGRKTLSDDIKSDELACVSLKVFLIIKYQLQPHILNHFTLHYYGNEEGHAITCPNGFISYPAERKSIHNISLCFLNFVQPVCFDK